MELNRHAFGSHLGHRTFGKFPICFPTCKMEITTMPSPKVCGAVCTVFGTWYSRNTSYCYDDYYQGREEASYCPGVSPGNQNIRLRAI